MAQRIRRAILNFINFVRLLFTMPPPRGGVSNAGAKLARGAMHVRGGGGDLGGFSGSSQSDSFLGEAIASGHRQKVYGDPNAEIPVIGYGQQAPKHQRQTSRYTIALLILMAFVIIIAFLSSLINSRSFLFWFWFW